MVRLSLALLAFVSTIGLAQATVPNPESTATQSQSALDRSYFVFFESGKAGLTPEARQILHSAAQRALATGPARVRVMMPTENKGATMLLQNRARAVKAELVRDGVKPYSINNADQPEDVAYIDANRHVRAWLDRITVVEVTPVPNAAIDGRVG